MNKKRSFTRKETPLYTGLFKYFPDALRAVAQTSFVGNEQHHKDKPLHWDKNKSTDHADCLLRHLQQAGEIDDDGVSHTAKVAWRALALLQTEIEKAKEKGAPDDAPLPDDYILVDYSNGTSSGFPSPWSSSDDDSSGSTS